MSILRWSRLLGSNPLLRPLDRLEELIRLVVIVAVLASVPIACAVGIQVYTDDAARIRVENTTRAPTTATVEALPSRIDETPGYRAPVRWLHDGQPHTEMTSVPRSAEIGSSQTIWLDRSGALVGAPRRPEAALITGIGVTVLLFATTAVAGRATIATSIRILDRRRLAAWETAWLRMDHQK